MNDGPKARLCKFSRRRWRTTGQRPVHVRDPHRPKAGGGAGRRPAAPMYSLCLGSCISRRSACLGGGHADAPQALVYIYIPNTYIIVRVCVCVCVYVCMFPMISKTTQPILTYNISNWPELSQECLGLLYFPKKILEKVQKRPKMDLPGFFFEKNHFQSKILSRKSENVIGQLMSYE